MQKFQDYIFSSPSVGLPRPVPNATVLVLNYPAMTVATIYSDNGITPTANPFLSAGDGKIAFYAADGHYSIQVSGQGINGTPTTNDILLEDAPADFVTLAQLAASSGSSLVGFIGTTTGEVATNVSAYLNLRVKGLKKSFGCAADDLTDDTTKINTAFASGKIIEAEDGTYKIAGTLLVPANQKVFGYGQLNTIFKQYSDAVAMRLTGLNADIKDFKIVKSGTHTNNLLEVGSDVLQAGRNVIERLWVEGAGNDNLSVRYGSLGSIRDCTFLSAGRDNVNFTIETNSNNAWVFDGYNDIRGAVRDGLNLASGSSQSDPNAPKSMAIRGVVLQNNGRYGLYCGTRSNSIEMYGEANTTKDLFFDTFAYGNKVVLVEGAYTDNGTGNDISYHNMSAVYVRGTVSKQYFSGASAAGWRVSNDDGAAGYVDFHKTAANAFEFLADGSSANQAITLKHNNASFKLNLLVNGDITPVAGRLLGAKGADVASANNLVLGGDGNFFAITGTTQINLLSVTGWTGGSVVYLVFASGATVKHNQAGSGANRQILLAGGVDYVATANDTLTLGYHSANNCWYELGRAVI